MPAENKTNRLFTYVDNEYVEDKEILLKGKEFYSLPARLSQHYDMDALTTTSIMLCNGRNTTVEFCSSRNQSLVNHLPLRLPQKMYIMADLSENLMTSDGKNEKATDINSEEAVLCVLSLGPTNILTVAPRFNTKRNPYKVCSKRSGDVFNYVISNDAVAVSESLENGRTGLTEQLIHERQNERLLQITGAHFEMPEEQTVRLFVNGEITASSSFGCSGIYVQYYLEMPATWKVHNKDLLYGRTQVAFPHKCQGIKHMFSHPLEFDFLYRTGLNVEPIDSVSTTWPILLLEVMSVDFWNRTQTEGYGYLELPRALGEHVTKVSCWLPSGESVTEELRRFFVGGTSQLEDVTYAAIPGNLENEHLIKYGFRTKTSGNIVFRFNCAIQSWSSLDKTADKKLIHVDDAQGR